MGGSISKASEKAKRTPLGALIAETEKKHESKNENNLSVDTYTELTRAESAISNLSPSLRNSLASKVSCANTNSSLANQWGILRRANNNSSPSFSTHVTSLTESKVRSQICANPLEAAGNVRPTGIRYTSTSPGCRSRADSKDNLQWKESPSLGSTDDVGHSLSDQIADAPKNLFDGDTKQSTEDTNNFKSRMKCSKESLNMKLSGNLLKPCSSILSLKSPKQLSATGCIKNPSTGDVSTGLHPAILKRNQQFNTNVLAGKPPTPPPKSQGNRDLRSSRRVLVAPPKRSSEPTKNSTLPRRAESPSPTKNPVRTSSLPRSSRSDKWIRLPRERSKSPSPTASRRNRTHSASADNEAAHERPGCLSRIEYTFYITDTDENQRPFYDRRIEAVARASQCNICLHKPSDGCRPVYYKGNRVLPVTISSRTMIALKRCIARLDIQYPYFNVKAFCPPDMY